jgi:Fe-S cluster assembly protein SufD
MPGSRYTQVRGLDLNVIAPILPDVDETMSEVPEDLRGMLTPGEAVGLYAQLDGQVVRRELIDSLEKQGVIFADIGTAVCEHPELVRRYMALVEAPGDRITALRQALFSSGFLVYVPKGVEIQQPLKAIQLLTRPGVGLFTQSFLIAEPESAVTLLEECASPGGMLASASLQAGSLHVHVGRGARVSVAGVEDWNPRVFHFVRRRGLVEGDARLKWTLGWLGGRLVMSHVESVLDGPGAEVEDIQVFFTGGRQHFDLTSNLLHQKPHTKGEVTVKGALKGKSKAVFWGLIRIEPGAQGANAFQSERTLLLEDGPRSDAVPSLEIEANDVRCTHAAAASQIDEEQIFYLRSRGLDADEAKQTIVEGFFEPTIAAIPLPAVQERIRGLIERKWQGDL